MLVIGRIERLAMSDTSIAIRFLEGTFVLDYSTLSTTTGGSPNLDSAAANTTLFVAHDSLLFCLHLALPPGKCAGACGTHAAGFKDDALEALFEPVQADEDDECVYEDRGADTSNNHYCDLLIQVQLVDVDPRKEWSAIGLL
jgi:hypothetical protein